MEDLKLELDHTYLTHYGWQSSMLSSVTVLLITAKGYHLRWNNGLDSSDSWMLKEEFEKNYTVVEDISDFVVAKPQEYNYTITYGCGQPLQYYYQTTENCGLCYGSGQIPDNNSTAGTKTCTFCNGSGKTVKTVDILPK